jgi:hypothetical protein
MHENKRTQLYFCSNCDFLGYIWIKYQSFKDKTMTSYKKVFLN